jgi:hypothetical protein
MDIKELNKSQLILLAVLLSFITSIATGITTVTLMQQAPKSITVPVNRVVQQTVDKIEQVEGKTVTQTVVIKEEDLVVAAIANNQSAVFSVTKDIQNPDFTYSEISAGRGFAISNDGTVVVDATLVPDKETYYLTNSSGKFKADFISTNKAGFSFLKIGAPVNGTDKAVFAVPSFGDITQMKVGQQVLLLGNTVTSSIFEGLNANKSIDLNVSKANAGGLILDLDGDALGMALSPDNASASFVSIQTINDALTPPASTTPPAASSTTPAVTQ